MITVETQNTVTRAVSKQERRTYGQTGGLAIVKNEGFQPWSVTHVASGLMIGSYSKLPKARKFMAAIADLTDWTASAATLKAKAKQLCPQMRAISQQIHRGER